MVCDTLNNEKNDFHDLFANGWVESNKYSFKKEYENAMETLEFSYQPETSTHNEGEQFLYLRRRRD